MEPEANHCMGGVFKRKGPGAEALFQLAQQHFEQGDARKVLECLQAALEADPNYVPARALRSNICMMMSQWAAAVDDLQALIKLDPTNAARHHNNLGSVLRELGQPERALGEFNRAIQLDPRYPKPYYNRSQALRTLERSGQAMSDLNQAIELDPNYLKAYIARGALHWSEGRYQEAQADFQTCMRLEPGNPEHRAQYALALSNGGRREEALEHFSQCLGSNWASEREVWVLHNMATTLGELGRDDEAEEGLNHAIRIEPRDPDLYYNRGNTFFRRGRYQEAERDYARALEMRPGMVCALVNQSSVWLALGRLAEARQALDRVLEALPDQSQALFNRGRLNRLEGRFSEALADLERLLRVCPDDAEARHESARAQSQNQEPLPPRLAPLLEVDDLPAPDPPDPPEETGRLLQRLQAGESPEEILTGAIKARSLQAARAALDAGASARGQKVPALAGAILSNHLGLIGLLLDRGASLTEPIAGFPPLSFCVSVWTEQDTEQDKARTAAFLVGRGADVNGANDLGATPLDDALISEKSYLAAALQSLGGRPGLF